MEQKKEKTWIYAVCIFGILLLPLVILILTPKGNGGMYAKIESHLSDAIVKYNRREHLELRLTTTGENEDHRTDLIWISGDNWLCDTMLITPNGQKTFMTLQYEGKLYHKVDGNVTCTEEIAKHPNISVDRMQMVYDSWERQPTGAFTAWGEIEAAVSEQEDGIFWKRVEYDVDWMENLRQMKTIRMTKDRVDKQIVVLDILGWNKKLCRDQIEKVYTQLLETQNNME